MALLKHPLTRLGLDAFDVRRAARALEIAAFRTLYLGRGLDGIAAALERAPSEAVDRRAPPPSRRPPPVAGRLARRATIWSRACEPPSRRCSRVFAAERRAAAAGHRAGRTSPSPRHCARCPSPTQTEAGLPLWQGEAGTAASTFFTGLLDPQCRRRTIAAGRLRRSLSQPHRRRERAPARRRASAPLHLGTVRGAPAAARRRHPRLAQRRHLAGGRRSRPVAQPADAPGARPAVAGGGDRPRRARLHLAARRRRASTSRAPQKIDGVPTVPSRWLMRLQALLAGLELGDALQPDQPWLGWARTRDHAQRLPRIRAPEPRRRWRCARASMSVTRIETLDRQPLRDLRPRHPEARAAADARRRRPTRRCAAASSTRR